MQTAISPFTTSGIWSIEDSITYPDDNIIWQIKWDLFILAVGIIFVLKDCGHHVEFFSFSSDLEVYFEPLHVHVIRRFNLQIRRTVQEAVCNNF